MKVEQNCFAIFVNWITLGFEHFLETFVKEYNFSYLFLSCDGHKKGGNFERNFNHIYILKISEVRSIIKYTKISQLCRHIYIILTIF